MYFGCQVWRDSFCEKIKSNLQLHDAVAKRERASGVEQGDFFETPGGIKRQAEVSQRRQKPANQLVIRDLVQKFGTKRVGAILDQGSIADGLDRFAKEKAAVVGSIHGRLLARRQLEAALVRDDRTRVGIQRLGRFRQIKRRVDANRVDRTLARQDFMDQVRIKENCPDEAREFRGG